MDTGTLIANRILALCTEKNITLNRLGFLCGITQSTLNNIIHGGSKNPTVDTVRRICIGLNMSLKAFFDTPEFDAAVLPAIDMKPPESL